MLQLGYPRGMGFWIGVLETILLVLYVVPRTSVLGAILFMGVFGGAIASHLRVGDPLFSHDLFGVYLGAVMWGGLWLRDPALRAVFPVRRVAPADRRGWHGTLHPACGTLGHGVQPHGDAACEIA